MLVELVGEFNFSTSYATLLNCWKFLRAYLYQVEKGNLVLDGLHNFSDLVKKIS